ncbi:S1C family serine protease [bacterium]|nr:S1C family serine protease [bacterium]MDB4393989.1 S1C family serine protease [Rhodopirellula sp.]MDB4561272.1 S1C family serine protease [bacterium]
MIANFASRFEAALHIYLLKPSVTGKSCLVAVTIVFFVVGLSVAVSAAEAQPPKAKNKASAVESLGTKIPVPSELQGILTSGEIPETLQQLQLLEQQFGRVSAAARYCTVSVKIGQAQGCGVIIDGEGKVLTAAHVAMRPNKPATVILANGRRLKAMTLGSNKNVDAGMLQISPGQNEGEDWPHATLGSSGKLSPGMWCIATGHPSGFDQDRGVVTRVGRISRVNRSALRTDCALIGGDSGGPLFDLSGQLIAIHSRIGNDVEENLHIPIDNYSNSWERLVAGDFWGSLPGFRPVLGVQGSSQIEEAVIDVVRLGSAAKKAGIQKGDIIKEFGDRKINDFQSLKEAVAETMPGEIVRVRGLRDGSPVFFRVVIGRGE